MTTKPVPAGFRKVILVNPTKYLGNFLLAGGLMQQFAVYCGANGIALKIVVDESFRFLCRKGFPAGALIYYPRGKIYRAGYPRKLSLYLDCLKQIRGFKADLAFNIEEDSVANRLTQLSGARFKLGCSTAKHRHFYDRVLPVSFEDRPAGRRHRWYSYYEVFAALGLPEPVPGYIDISLPEDAGLGSRLRQEGLDLSRPVIALHAGATKEYKKWPLENMISLCGMLVDAGLQPVLLGAGTLDREANKTIKAALAASAGSGKVVDLCDKFSLEELAMFLRRADYMVGNDSGPFHLGSALGVPGSVLFGPTDKNIWRPLGNGSEVLQGSFVCDPACSKAHCLFDHRCLREITPRQVFDAVTGRLHDKI